MTALRAKFRKIPDAQPLLEIVRGGAVESRHRGHVAVVDGRGKTVARLGSPELPTFLRSSAKPFQALPILLSGAAERFKFSDQELAVACGSHPGEPVHVDVVSGMLKKIGLEPGALFCGRYSTDGRGSDRDRAALMDNCSGKHAGMLATSRQLEAPIDKYLEAGHPVQQMIATVIARFAGIEVADLATATDGCGAPTFHLPVTMMASMFARLAARPSALGNSWRSACRRIGQAMTSFPEMVAGAGGLDAEIMRVGAKRLLVKSGAEGVLAIAVFPGGDWPYGLGIALKIEDGNARARGPIAIELLHQLELINHRQLKELNRFADAPVENRLGEVVGSVRAGFSLDKA